MAFVNENTDKYTCEVGKSGVDHSLGRWDEADALLLHLCDHSMFSPAQEQVPRI